MALYGTTNSSASSPALIIVATTDKTHLSLTAATATLRRAFIYEFGVGAAGVPAASDSEINWSLNRQTTLGTGVAMTINATETTDAASGSVATANYTVEPTSPDTGKIWALGANQRASYRWVVAPGGPGELVVPATNVNGFAMKARSTNYILQTSVSMMWRE